MSIVSSTEAKTAALQDLEIRSSSLPLTSSATGTGTDNIIVVQGDGMVIDNAGGHAKMGELIARAAYAGVTEEIYKQNGIVRQRDIFQRLRDRHLNIRQLVSTAHKLQDEQNVFLVGHIGQLLLDPAYSGFLETAMALNDGIERETVNDFLLFNAWCLNVASRIAGTKVDVLTPYFTGNELPKPLAMALNTIFTGISIGSSLAQKDNK